MSDKESYDQPLRVWPLLPMISIVTGGRGPWLAFGSVGVEVHRASQGEGQDDIRVHPLSRWPEMTDEMKADCVLPEDWLAEMLRRALSDRKPDTSPADTQRHP